MNRSSILTTEGTGGVSGGPRPHSESLLSELEPLELLLPDSEELLLLSLEGPPGGAEPDFSFLAGFLPPLSCPRTSCSRRSSSLSFS